ncbi:hypothetical protein KKG22_04135 [Patescibacteria group bacterium]|nr:hypothetical protein [Patescibacteria group bacterium]MBU1721331.1 hypothetical protein [Patescibacteria group bacterium]MBU1901616.1 hypothetical protein [Patescibacteria group bacterium]
MFSEGRKKPLPLGLQQTEGFVSPKVVKTPITAETQWDTDIDQALGKGFETTTDLPPTEELGAKIAKAPEFTATEIDTALTTLEDDGIGMLEDEDLIEIPEISKRELREGATIVSLDTPLFAEKYPEGRLIIETAEIDGGTCAADLHDGGKEKQQDSLVITQAPDGRVVFSIADGVSTSRNGENASSVIAQAVDTSIKNGGTVQEGILMGVQELSKETQIRANRVGLIGKDSFNPFGEDTIADLTTYSGLEIGPNAEATGYLVGDGNIYISRASNRENIEKIQDGNLTTVDFTQEEELYNNPDYLDKRKEVGQILMGQLDLKTLAAEHKIPEKLIRFVQNKPQEEWPPQVLNLIKTPEQQAEMAKPIDFGTLEAGDVVITCSDGPEDNLLSREIQKIISDIEQEQNGHLDPNLIRHRIMQLVLERVKSVQEGNPTVPFAKVDNLSLIVYVHTGDKIMTLDTTDLIEEEEEEEEADAELLDSDLLEEVAN